MNPYCYQRSLWMTLIIFSCWISGPKTDEEGRNFTECQNMAVYRCNLHLSQQLSQKFPTTRSIPIMSSKSAIGMVIGSGNMGQSLKQKNNVFVSADAGLSWHQVLKGSYYFNMGKFWFCNIISYRNYPLRGNFLGVLEHTTASIKIGHGGF